MIGNEYKIIDEALEFYNIDFKYKSKCYNCFGIINNNQIILKSFELILIKLFKNDFTEVKKTWDYKDIRELFKEDIDPFITNLIILFGYHFHKKV